jgi:hypothetical protein
MKPTVRKWHDIAEPYREESWQECARVARALVDQNPYDLSTRALLASLLLRTRQEPLALIQYERLLPLAVGQGDLFRALGTQRRLDLLHAAENRHPDRYRAMQDWFRYLVDAAPASEDAAAVDPAAPVLEPATLIQLPADSFSMIAERASVLTLDMAPQVLNEPEGILWVVYFGRVRWAIATGAEEPRTERTAEEGEIVYLPPGAPSARWLEIQAETPAEVIQLDPGLAHLHIGPRAETRPSPVAVTPPPERVDTAGRRPALAEKPPAAARSTPTRDPIAEPEVAAGSRRDRRRHGRMDVMLGTRVALLGEDHAEAGSVIGRVTDISRTGMGLAFPAQHLRHEGGLRPEAVVRLQIAFDGSDEPLVAMGRVAWIELHLEADIGGVEFGRVGIEFVAMPAEARTRLIHLLDAAERSAAGDAPAA